MTQHIKAPIREPIRHPAIFLAGGISGCPDWQKNVAEQLEEAGQLEGFDITILNPRRDNFPMEDSEAGREQIKWEYDALRKADLIAFWFPCETLCPITLFELGYWLGRDTPLLVAVHPDYKRKFDVMCQSKLEREPSTLVLCEGFDTFVKVLKRMAPEVQRKAVSW